MKTCKVFIPYGGMGIQERYQKDFDDAIAKKPDAIATDCGSTDSGPAYLGTGKGKYSREAIKFAMRLCITSARKLKVPLLLGSCGTCGTDYGVDEYYGILEEVCKEENITVKVARIYTQQDPAVLKKYYKEGKITPLRGAVEIDENTFDECTNIVALAGVEPFQKALQEGCDVIMCGRATDTAIIASMPIMMGMDEAEAWHAAKICECGPACLEGREGGTVATFGEHDVVIEPSTSNEKIKATPHSTSAHMLYEVANPFEMIEPGVVVDVSTAVYEPYGERGTRITGAKVEKMPYTMKLEGASLAGYQTINISGYTDRNVMADVPGYIESLKEQCYQRLKGLGIEDDYSLSFKPYGYNAVTNGPVRKDFVPNEIGLITVVTSSTQERAHMICKSLGPLLLHPKIATKNKAVTDHIPVALRSGGAATAFPFSPVEIDRGPVYEFRLFHVVHIEDPLELVRFKYTTIEGGK